MGKVNISEDRPGPGRPLVDVAWLAAHLDDEALVVLDAGIPPHDNGGLRIPGARRFDLEGAFSDPSSPLPHTVPDVRAAQDEARRLGIGQDSTVVVYDIAELYSAARAWWLLRTLGVARVAVLDGGLAAWQAAGHPCEGLDPEEHLRDDHGDFTASLRDGNIVDADTVEAALASPAGAPRSAVIDARSRGRFRGLDPEPRPGLRSGHMPGAANLPYLEVQRDGRLLPAADLQALLDPLTGDSEQVVFTCGSGVTACVLALAASVAGRDEDGLCVYDGSWTEWGGADSGRTVVAETA